MLGQLAELVRVRTIIPRRREGDERDALRGRLLGGGRGGDDEGQAEQRHGCVRLACWRGFAGRCFALPCAVKAPRYFVVAALGKVLAARGFHFCQYSPGEALAKLGRRDASVSIDARLVLLCSASTVCERCKLHR